MSPVSRDRCNTWPRILVERWDLRSWYWVLPGKCRSKQLTTVLLRNPYQPLIPSMLILSSLRDKFRFVQSHAESHVVKYYISYWNSYFRVVSPDSWQDQAGASLACVSEEPSADTDHETSSGDSGDQGPVTSSGASVYGRRNPWGNHSYAELISQAISSSSERRMTLSQIYDWMVANIPYFSERQSNSKSAGWKVNICILTMNQNQIVH